MKYYTYVNKLGNNIYHRYIEDGIRKLEVVDSFDYEIYLPDPKGKDISLYGDKLTKMPFNSISDMNEFINKNKHYINIFGNTNPIYQFIAKTYPDEILMDNDNYVVLNFDIEVSHDDGFPNPKQAKDEIQSISCEVIGKPQKITFGTKESKRKVKNSYYVECPSEKSLILKFLQYWNDVNPDFYTGWFCESFDIPYVINRTIKLFDKQTANRFSPFHNYTKHGITEKEVDDELRFDILGVTAFDYIALYKKYSRTKQENNKLDTVGDFEIQSKKVDYSKWGGSLMRLYNGDYDVDPATNKNTLEPEDRYARLRTILKKKLGKPVKNYTL